MIDSPVVKEWKAEAAKKARAEALIELLQERFTPLPQEILSAILACEDVEKIRRWNLKAGTAATLDQFRQETGL